MQDSCSFRMAYCLLGFHASELYCTIKLSGSIPTSIHVHGSAFPMGHIYATAILPRACRCTLTLTHGKVIRVW